MDSLHTVFSFNTNGLGQKRKRIAVFERLKKLNGIILLQETHSTPTIETEWRNEWSGDIFFSHGTSSSCGTAILLPNNTDYNVLEQVKDEHGRFIGIKLKYVSLEFCIFNVYAPTLDKKREQISFANYLQSILCEYDSASLVIGGDFNFYMDPNVDKKGTIPANYDNDKYREEICALLDSLDLVDPWRIHNPGVKRYTWHARGKASRLDYIFCSEHLLNDMRKCTINPGLHSDHSIIQLSIGSSFSQERGKGLWKFNILLLHDEKYVTEIKRIIEECKVKYAEMNDKGLKWDMIKCDIRAFTIPYCVRKKKEKQKLKQDLENKLTSLHEAADSSDSTDIDINNEISATKSELEDIENIEAKGIIFRSKMQWSEEGEKNSKYFLSLEKRNYVNKLITQLDVDGEIISDPVSILSAEKTFYNDLYRDKCDCMSNEYKEASAFFCEENEHPVLNDFDKILCDADITEKEILSSLKLLNNGRSPGSDGIPADFYKFFWNDIKLLVVESLLYAIENGKMSIEQRRGILTLLPKHNKVRLLLKNWRPISLLNTDYKILAKLFAERLKKVLHKIINQDQTGYLKGRFIGQNIRLIDDVLFFTNQHNVPGVIMTIDFEKAFDSLNWNFLDKVLQNYNFGEKFRFYVKTLYNGIESAVTNNGHASEFFTLERGVRQGCPLSAYLFIIAVEVLAHKIRNDDKINGIKVGNRYIKISQLADDTTIFLSDTTSIEQVLNIFNLYSICAGLKVNIEKTNAMYIGSLKTCDYYPHGLSWIKDCLKTLGVVFTHNPEDSYQHNFSPRISNMKNLFRIWKQRKLSFKGKVTIINSLGISPLVYISSIISTPQKVIHEVESIILDFFWDGKRPKISKDVLFQTTEKGGLKLCDFKSKVKALLSSWIKRLVTSENATWKLLPQLFFGSENLHFFFSLKNDSLDNYMNIPTFYKDIYRIWTSLYVKEPTTSNEIQNEILWNNKFITQLGKPLDWVNWQEKGICKVIDLLDESGQFMNHYDLNMKYGLKSNFLEVLQIRQCLPLHWRQNISTCNKKFQVDNVLFVKLENVKKNVNMVQCRDYYNYFITSKDIKPHSQKKWCESFPKLISVDTSIWNRIYTLTYCITRETKLQSFQYRIIHRILPCNKWLNDIKILESNICNFCDEIDTIQHFLIECKCLDQFWDSFSLWWNRMSPVTIENMIDLSEFKECVIFGFPGNEDIVTVLNLCVLLAKYCIYIQKIVKNRSNIDLYDYLVYLKSKLNTELLICTRENKLHKFEKFSFIYDQL